MSKNSGEQKKGFSCIHILNICFCFCIVAMVCYYVATVNDLTIKSIKISELKEKEEHLKELDKTLTVNSTSLRSYTSLNKKANEMDMVLAANINYIDNSERAFARK